MNYNDAQEYINEKNKLGSVPGLDNEIELLKRLDNPQNRCKCLHIAGTNGKGSIFAFVENILLKMGYKTGRYVSPTISHYLERFQINQQFMSEDRFALYIEEISQIIKEMESEGLKSPTAFEIETAVAYKYFADENVDFALIECGMGGRLDATNVIDKPLATVFASISLDHMQFLGDTVEMIAEEKAGIIKKDCICVSYPQLPEVSDVLRNKCRKVNTQFFEVDMRDVCEENIDLTGTRFIWKKEEYHIKLLGVHQIYNASTALLLIEKLYEKGYLNLHYDRLCVNRGLEETVWNGRMTVVSQKPLVICDGAHNEQAWKMLALSLNKYFTNKHIIFIMGVLGDKEYEKMIEILLPYMYAVIAITPDNPRALAKEIIADKIRCRGVDCMTAQKYEQALEMAYGMVNDNSMIMICGSLSFLNEYLQKKL